MQLSFSLLAVERVLTWVMMLKRTPYLTCTIHCTRKVHCDYRGGFHSGFLSFFSFLQKGEAVSVDAEMAAVLQCSRFAPHFTVQSSDNTSASEGETQQVRVYFMALYHITDPIASDNPIKVKL